MFTGIVTDMGEVLELEQRGDLRARIGTAYDVARVDIGASIACEGVCLTVIALGTSPRNWFDVQISAESVSKTNLSGWKVGKRLNLERALKVGDELGGHIVSGHIDGVAEVVRVAPEGEVCAGDVSCARGFGQVYRPQRLGRAERHVFDGERG